MEIREVVRLSGISSKTIRYYEEFKVLPAPERKKNGYRDYSNADVDRLRLVAGLRRLDFSLNEAKEILDLRDRRIAPCKVLLSLMDRKVEEINHRITELQALERDLRRIYSLGLTFPVDDVEGKNCVCHLVSDQATKKTSVLGQ